MHLAEFAYYNSYQATIGIALMRPYMDVVEDHLLHGMRFTRKRFLSGTFRRKLS